MNKCPTNSECIQYTFPAIGHECKCDPGYNGTSCQLCMYFNYRFYKSIDYTYFVSAYFIKLNFFKIRSIIYLITDLI